MLLPGTVRVLMAPTAGNDMRAGLGPGPDLLRCAEVLERFRLGKTQLYRLIRAGEFPPPVRIGARGVRWRRADLDHWLATRPAAMPGATSVDLPAGAATGAG